MLHWGLELEHNMALRFSNKLDTIGLKDPLVNKIYKDVAFIPEYLFIDSNLLFELYNNYVDEIISDKNRQKDKHRYIDKHINNDKKKESYLDECVKKNINFPFDNKKYFNVEKENKTRELLSYYIQKYIAKYFIYLNFSVNAVLGNV